jgi:uncharacterized protein
MARAPRAAFGFFLLLFALAAWAQVAVPDLSRRVTDLTATLSAQQVAELDARLAALETRKGSQIAVLIVPTLEGEDIAQYGIRVADKWKIGRGKIDDGAILIVAKNDRKLRIEVGYGLEGAIPDAIAKRVIAETITPYFKAGDFYGGISAGVGQLEKLIDGEPLPAPARQDTPGATDSLLTLLVIGFVIGNVLVPMLGRGTASGVAGLGTAGLGWMASGAVLSSLLLGGGVLLAVLLLGAMGRGGGGGWGSGGYGGGGFGGGGGGSWGGGGGGFGGGGASGSW